MLSHYFCRAGSRSCGGFVVTVLFTVSIISLLPKATAQDVTWTLNGVTFDDGATLKGSFVINSSNNAVAFDLTTAGGFEGFPDITFSLASGGKASHDGANIYVFEDAKVTQILDLIFSAPLPTTGGTKPLDALNFTLAGDNERSSVSGDAVGAVPVPENSTFQMLGLTFVGYFGFLLVSKRQLLNIRC
jgi:hypothetical protein